MTDAFRAAWWDYTQVFAWVSLGDSGIVAKAADNADHSTIKAHPALLDGREEGVDVRATPIDEPWLERVASERQSDLTAHGYPGDTCAVDNAEIQIHAALSVGRLEAYGFANGSGEPAAVPQCHWPDLKIYWHDGEDSYAETRQSLRSECHSLRFKREAAIAIWPDLLALKDSMMRPRPTTRTSPCARR